MHFKDLVHFITRFSVDLSTVKSLERVAAGPSSNLWPSTQVCKTRTCVRCGMRTDGWTNRFASRLPSSCKSQKSQQIHCTDVDTDTDVAQRWPNGEKFASTCV